MKKVLLAVAACLALVACDAKPRSEIWVAGSSTVFPFASRVAENFQRTGSNTVRVESLGTGGGIQAFCSGIGVDAPDIATASRRMKDSERELCETNGVTDIVEIKIGYDGLVFASARGGPVYNFVGGDFYRALSAAGAGTNTHWNQVNPKLPATRIQVYGPPPTSGTRDSWLELAMEASAKTFPALAALEKEEFQARAHTLREDGGWIDSGENDNAIVQTLVRTPDAFGVFGFSFLNQNTDTVQAHRVNGVLPTLETISSGEYPISRSMFIYVKRQNFDTIPGLKEYVIEFMTNAGPNGYLADRGLIPLHETELAEAIAAARAL